VPCAVLFDLEPGVIDAVCASLKHKPKFELPPAVKAD
jgi:hypothetical protein